MSDEAPTKRQKTETSETTETAAAEESSIFTSASLQPVATTTTQHTPIDEEDKKWMRAPSQKKAPRVGDDFQAILPPIQAKAVSDDGNERKTEEKAE